MDQVELDKLLAKATAEDRLVLRSTAGSHLYGLNVPGSDFDTRGIFINTMREILNLNGFQNEAGDEKADTKFFCLDKFLRLSSGCNPNVVEMFYIPAEHVQYKSPVYDILVENRDYFMSKKAQHTFLGYAYNQLTRSKGLNKKANLIPKYTNEVGLKYWLYENKVDPAKVLQTMGSDFVKYLNKVESKYDYQDGYVNVIAGMNLMPPKLNSYIYVFQHDANGFAFRPVKFSGAIDQHDVSGVEHCPEMYRVYKNGTGFIKDGQIVCASISKEREMTDFVGVININTVEYKKANEEWKSFWEWMACRNEERYTNAWDADHQYDCKNMMHNVRVLLSAKNIAVNGCPTIRSNEEERKFLLDIRAGKYGYEYLLKYSTELMDEVKGLFEKSSLPETSNHKRIAELYTEILQYQFKFKV